MFFITNIVDHADLADEIEKEISRQLTRISVTDEKSLQDEIKAKPDLFDGQNIFVFVENGTIGAGLLNALEADARWEKVVCLLNPNDITPHIDRKRTTVLRPGIEVILRPVDKVKGLLAPILRKAAVP